MTIILVGEILRFIKLRVGGLGNNFPILYQSPTNNRKIKHAFQFLDEVQSFTDL